VRKTAGWFCRRNRWVVQPVALTNSRNVTLSALWAVLLGLLLIALQSIPIAAIALERTALVVGNSAYRNAPLRNPVNDATDMAQVLEKQLGFEVILRTDVTQQQFEAAAREFRQRLQRRGGVGLFYYAGHGIQADGHNYLIPVSANIDSETDVKYKSVDAGYVLGQMDEADASLNIVILDACRNNPYERSFRSASRGLVRLEIPAGELGSLLAYSTAPGTVAADGSGRNSPYTKHLLRALRLPDENIYRIFQKVRIGVHKETSGQQIPWVSESLMGDFYFLRSQVDAIDKTSPEVTPTRPGPTKQTATLTVRSNVYGDQVYIDGQFKGSTRLDLELEPGWHAVTVEKEDYAPFEERILLASAEHRTVRAQLQRPSSIPSEAQLRRAGLRQLSDDELMELHAGRTLYLEDLRAGTAIPAYFLPTGWRRLMFEGRYFEGHYWVSNDTLCAESVRGGDVCTPLFKDGDIYRLCDPRDDGECRWVIRRIEAGNPEGLQPQPQHESQPETWIEPVTGMEFVWIPSGCIDMGSPKTEEGRNDDERQHRVCIEGFWLGKHEVTNVQYRRFSGGHDSGEHRGQTLNGDDHPVVMVDWNAADAFAEWLSQQTGAHLRLPTEAEWEYAARAGTGTVRYWGDDPGTHEACAYANVYDRTAESMFVSGRPHHACEDRHAVTAPVGQFQPNAFGLYDILGNAWEWTCSVYDEAYRGAEKDCASKGSGAQRVIRGGSWDIPPHLARSAGRGEATPDDRSDYLGFRLARIP